MTMMSVKSAALQEAVPEPANTSTNLARSAGSEGQVAFQGPEHSNGRSSSVADQHDGNLVSDEHLPDTEKRIRLASQDSIRTTRADTLEGSPIEQLNGLNLSGSSTPAKGTPSTVATQSAVNQHTIPVRNDVPLPRDQHAVATMDGPSITATAQPPPVDPHAVAMGDHSATEEAQRPANQHTERVIYTTATPEYSNPNSVVHTNTVPHTLVRTNSDIRLWVGSFGTTMSVQIGTDFDSNACIEWYIRFGASDGSEASRRRLSNGTQADTEETTSTSQRRLSNGTQVTNANREASTDSNSSNLSRHNGDVASSYSRVQIA